MIQSGIKFHLILFALRLYPDATQVFFPSPGGLDLCLVKRELSGLRLQVMPGILDRSIRQAHLSRYRGIFLEVIGQIDTCPNPFDFTRTGLLLLVEERPKRLRLMVYNRREIKRNGSSCLVFLDIFRFGDYPTFDTSIFRITDIGILYGTTLPLPVSDIKQDVIGISFRERETLESHARCSGKFRPNPVIVQHYRIISGIGYLIFPCER